MIRDNDKKRTVVVIAEDDPDDRLLIKDALKDAMQQAIEVIFVQDGAELLDYLHQTGRYTGREQTRRPELILLDINMPRKGGLEVLEEIKRDHTLRLIPVVVLTTSRAPDLVERSYELGGNGFITKPDSYKALVDVMQSLERYWFQTVQLP